MNRRKNIDREHQRLKKQRQKEKRPTKLIAFLRGCLAILKRPVSWLGFLATVLTLVGAWYAFKSKLEISYGTPTDRRDPYSTPFTLTNSGLLPLYDIKWEINLVDVEYENHGRIQDSAVGTYQKIPSLDPGQKTTIFLTGPYPLGGIDQRVPIRVAKSQIKRAELVCSLSYRDVLRLSETQDYRFLCVLTKDGDYEWMPYNSQKWR